MAAVGGAGGGGSVPPRNFKLLDELEDAQKGKTGSSEISLGLVRDDDTFMHDWQATIFQAPSGAGEARIYFLTLHASDGYPAAAPTVRFTSRINADFVDARGNVIVAKVPYLASWAPSKTMAGALAEIKTLITRIPRGTSQPADGSTY